jgi:SAM-dependent methyltransferase
MHPSSLNNMKIVRQKYLSYLNQIKNPIICDVGGLYDIPQKSYKQLFHDLNPKWIICDIVKHFSVTHTMTGPYSIPFEDNTFDLIVSGQMLEHCSNPFKSVNEMKRVLKTNHMMVLIAPSTGPKHDVQDGWRFMDDAFRFIIDDIGGIETVADWIDKGSFETNDRSSKWRDHMFVGKKVL